MTQVEKKTVVGLVRLLILREYPRDIVIKGLRVLKNMKHRGAVGADATTGDGAGIMTQIPHQLFTEIMADKNVNLPEAGIMLWGQFFCPVCLRPDYTAKVLLKI